jgi:hypothetical protein
VTVDDLKWEFAPWASLQTVGLNAGLAKAGSKTYERWHKAVLDFYRGEIPRHGAIWLTYYPNVMVEWYPHVLVISTLYPRAPNRTLNVVEFYYPEEIALFEREFVEAEQAAYFETSHEDDEIGERMDAGATRSTCRGAARSGRTSRRWKTACSTSTSSTGARWSASSSLSSRSRAMQSLWMLVAGLAFALMGVFVKIASAHFATAELVFWRALVQTLVAWALLWHAANRCARVGSACTCTAASPASPRCSCSSTR